MQAGSSLKAQVLASTGVQVLPAETTDRQQWVGSLPSLLLVWQSLAELAPQARVNAFVLSTDSAALAPKATSALRLQLLSREDADQALGRSANPAKPTMHAPEVVGAAPPTRLFNPFDAVWLMQGLPPLARANGQLKLPDAELSQWQWVGALSTPEKSSALLSFAGELYAVSPGQALGAHGGEITQVNTDHVVLREWQVNPQGQWQARPKTPPPAIRSPTQPAPARRRTASAPRRWKGRGLPS
jgi:hypothetical protein